MAANQALVAKLYRGVIEDVITGVRDSFLDEGVDEAVLQELKQIWESKLTASKAIDPIPDPAESQLQSKVQQTQNNAASSTSNQTSQSGAAQSKQTTGNSSAPSSGAAASSAGAAASNAAAMAVKLVPVQITVPAQPGVPNSQPKSITVQVPAHALQGGTAGAQLQAVLSSPAVTAALQLPHEIASSVLQTQIDNALRTNPTVRNQASSKGADNGGVAQLDGANASSSDEDDVDDDDDDDLEEDEDKDDEEHDDDNEENQEEEPLNSEDDVSDEDPSALFETDNVVVCQYDKITRSRNRWKFHLKDGIMNINGRDYVFQKANGDAEW